MEQRTPSELEIADALHTLKAALVAMIPDERLELRKQIFDDYCEHCGREEQGRTCYCTKDE